MRLYNLLILSLSLLGCAAQPKSGDDASISILSFHKEQDLQSLEIGICKEFSINNEDVEQFFKSARKVNSHAFHSEAIIFSCYYTGELKLNEKHYDWTIYPAGAGYLSNGDLIEQYFICDNEMSFPKHIMGL